MKEALCLAQVCFILRSYSFYSITKAHLRDSENVNVENLQLAFTRSSSTLAAKSSFHRKRCMLLGLVRFC